MRAAIVICTSRFEASEFQRIPDAPRSASLLGSYLSHPDFGGFDRVEIIADETKETTLEKLGATNAELPPHSFLFVHIISHVVGNSTGAMLAATDSDPEQIRSSDSASSFISTTELAEILCNQRAPNIAISIDTCLADTFQSELCKEITFLEKNLHQLNHRKKRLQFIVADENSKSSYSDDSGCAFTNELFFLLITSEISSRSSRFELSSMNEPRLRYKSKFLRFNYYSNYDDTSFIMGRTPNQNLTLPPATIRRLFSHSSQEKRSSISELKGHARLGNVARLRVIKSYLSLFDSAPQELHSNETSEALLELNRVVNGADAPGAAARSGASVIVYATRSWSSAFVLARELRQSGRKTIMFDLEFSREYEYRDIDLSEVISNSTDVYLILDDEWDLRVDTRLPELCDILESKPHETAGWIACPSFLQNASNAIRVPKGFNKVSLCELVEETNMSYIDIGDLDQAVFFDCLEANESLLRKEVRPDFSQSEDISEMFDGPPRSPSFLVFKCGGKFTLVVTDGQTQVDPTRLRPDHLPILSAELASEEDLRMLGLTRGHVGAVIPDHNHLLERVVVDGTIFFQFLLFPTSNIQVPFVQDGVGYKRKCTVSSFVRTLVQFYGTSKILYSNVSKTKRFNDEYLISLLKSHGVFTRFAPTPSNGLHLGNIRTAVVSYLFSLCNSETSRFHVRFDDTNPKQRDNQEEKARILEDLSWVGLPVNAQYSQSNSEARAAYELVGNLLEDSGIVVNDAASKVKRVDIDAVPHNFAYWLDLKRGPQFIHRVPTASSRGEELDYSIDWGDGYYKYKFAGVVDDVALNSLVIRDERQDDSLFTARQSIILGSVRHVLANPRTPRQRRLCEDVRNLAKHPKQFQGLKKKTKGRRPFPFPAPPLYLHVPRVCDGSGRVLSKRNCPSEFLVSTIKSDALVFPETIIAWVASTLGERFRKGLGLADNQGFEQFVARVGIKGFFEVCRDRIDFMELLDGQDGKDIRLRSMRRSDLIVLKHLPPGRFSDHFELFWRSQSLDRVGIDVGNLRHIYRYRMFFAGSYQIAELLHNILRLVLSGETEAALARCDEFLAMESHPRIACEELRELLFGQIAGPPVDVLINCSKPILQLNR